MGKTVVLATAGSYGDIAPFLSLAKALRDRDARPVLLLNPCERQRVEREGLEVRWVGEAVDLPALIRDNPRYMGLRGGELVVRDLYAQYARLLYPACRDAIREEKPACVVAHLGCFGATWAAWREATPLAVVHLAPLTWLSRLDRTFCPRWQRLLMAGLLPLLLRRMDSFLQGPAREAGLPSARGLFEKSLREADLVLGLWSPSFRKPFPDDPPQGRICGFPKPPDAADPLPEGLEAFLGETDDRPDERPVAFALGTSAVHVAGRFYRQAAEACRRLNRRGVLLGPIGSDIDGGDFVRAVPYAPYERVFPRCATVVHHAGIGTSAAVLRASASGVAVPFAHDQFDNAQRLRHLGTSHIRFRYTLTSRGLANAVKEALRPGTRDRAQAIAAELATEPDGAEVAADALVERFLA